MIILCVEISHCLVPDILTCVLIKYHVFRSHDKLKQAVIEVDVASYNNLVTGGKLLHTIAKYGMQSMFVDVSNVQVSIICQTSAL